MRNRAVLYMMFPANLLLVFLAEAMVYGAPQDWIDTLSFEDMRLGVFTLEEQTQKSSELQSDETAIYYEPAALDSDEPRVFSNYPFYIVNPARRLILKSEKSSNKKRVVKSTENEKVSPVTINTTAEQDDIAQGTQLYLDFGVKDKIEPKNAKDNTLVLTETNLLECLDLHIFIFHSKSGNTTEAKKVLETDKMKKFKMMSDADIIMAIQSRCSRPTEVVNKSLNEVRESQPKRKDKLQGISKTLTAGSTIRDETSTITTNSYETMSETSIEIPNVVSRYNKEFELEERQTDSPNNSELEDMVVSALSELKPSTMNAKDETVTISSTFISNSTEGPALEISLQNIDEHQDKNKENFSLFSSNKSFENKVHTNLVKETHTMSTKDLHNTVNGFPSLSTKVSYNTEEIRENELLTSTVPNTEIRESPIMTQNLESFASKPMSIEKNTEREKSKQNEQTTESSIPVTDTTYHIKDLYENVINVAIPSYMPLDEKRDETNNENGIVKKIDVEEQQSRNGDVLKSSSQPTTIRPKYMEKEIKIPKIVSKEFVNGTVISGYGGYEVLPNNDFKEHNDSEEASDENTISVPQKQNDINGKLYFVFDQYQVPARFIQNSEGEIHVGIDGNSLCEKLKSQYDDLLLFTKLCTF